jgi:hypothetical protein
MRGVWVVMLIAACWRQTPAEPLQDPPRMKAPPDPPWLHQRTKKSDRTDLSPLAASLSQVEMFALGGVGFTGEKSEGEKLTIALSHEPDALVMFERLAVDPNRASRLYAYWALRTLDPVGAQRHRAALAHDRNAITTAANVRELADEIDKMPPQRAMPKP